MRILFVGFTQSIHTVRWLRQILECGWDLHMFPSTQDWFPVIHQAHRKVTIHGMPSLMCPLDLDPSVRTRGFWPLSRGYVTATQVLPRLLPKLCDPVRALARLIQRLRPDIVHSLEIQNAGYLTLAAKERLGGDFPPWIVTNYGSDIYFYGNLKAHQPKIQAVLAACDYYSCEAERDVALARQFGFRGEVLPVLPNTGGFDLERARSLQAPGKTSERRLLVLKGYQTIFGRALTGLRALELCADALQNYRVAMHSVSPELYSLAEITAQRTAIPIDIIPFTRNHEDMLRLHGRARISVGLNISDGVSTSFLEALVMGSFPVQSFTASADEWVRDGETGILVHPEDPHEVAAAIRRAAVDDALVDGAAARNARVVAERLNYAGVQAQVIEMYQKIAGTAVREKKAAA